MFLKVVVKSSKEIQCSKEAKKKFKVTNSKGYKVQKNEIHAWKRHVETIITERESLHVYKMPKKIQAHFICSIITSHHRAHFSFGKKTRVFYLKLGKIGWSCAYRHCVAHLEEGYVRRKTLLCIGAAHRWLALCMGKSCPNLQIDHENQFFNFSLKIFSPLTPWQLSSLIFIPSIYFHINKLIKSLVL